MMGGYSSDLHERSGRRLGATQVEDISRFIEWRAGHGSLRTAAVAGLVSLIVLLVGSAAKDWQTGLPDGRTVLAIVFPLAFVFPAVVSIRAFAIVVDELASRRGRPGVGGAIRMIVTIAGYLVAATCALGLTRYPLDHLLLGGAIVRVILGIAAQQSLGNVFAGLVLLAARPFKLGHHIRVRSGALAGEFEGTVISMSLTYVTLADLRRTAQSSKLRDARRRSRRKRPSRSIFVQDRIGNDRCG